MNLEIINLSNSTYSKFLKRIRVDSKGCWLFEKSVNSKGYATFGYSIARGMYNKIKAHRYSYKVHKGEIPKNLVIDHLCCVKNCVNPEHLEAVPQKVNMQRGTIWKKLSEIRSAPEGINQMREIQKKRISIQLAATHCKNGHEYTLETTKMRIAYNRKNPSRQCLLCKRASWHKNKGKLTRA